MEATRKRSIQNGAAYGHLFPEATGIIKTIRRDAGVGDTLAFIQKIVPATLHQTKAIAAKLKAANTYETCYNIWHFVYNHIAYKKDQEGYEQVRSPRRSWQDRYKGVDCDCYTTFISSILTNLGIAHKLRITKYARDHFQHIYPIVPYPNARGYITLDCVTDQYDYEVPFTEKRDVNMDLQYLDGLPYDSGDGLSELGKLFKKKKKPAGGSSNPSDPNAVPPSGVKKKKGFKKLLNIANKVNPATLALRNGVLVAMKLNVGKIASRLRWSYLSPNEAAKRGVDPGRFDKLVKVRQKLENIFYGAGGKPENLKKAILKGKGNKDKAVAGLGMLFGDEMEGLDYISTNTPLSALLGPEIYHSENIEGMEGFEGFGELGEPVTLATVAAASAVIAGIVGMLKQVGDLFGGKKGQGSEDFAEDTVQQADKEAAATGSGSGTTSSTSMTTTTSSSQESSSSDAGSSYTDNASDPTAAGSSMPATTGSSTASIAKTNSDSGSGSGEQEGFWAKNKKWLLPVVIGAGGIAVIAIGMRAMKPPVTSATKGRSLHGPPRRKNHHRNKKHKRLLAPLTLS